MDGLRVVKWSARDALDWDGKGEFVEFPRSTSFAQTALSMMAATYGPFIVSNAKALAKRDKAFVIKTYGENVSYLARSYPERSRQMIIERLARINRNRVLCREPPR